MKKWFLSVGLVTNLVVSTWLISVTAQAKSNESLPNSQDLRFPIQKINGPSIQLPVPLQEKVNRVKVDKNQDRFSLTQAETSSSYTTMSSGGEILPLDVEKEINKNINKYKKKNSVLDLLTPFATDNRQRITTTTVHPYNVITYIEVQHADGDWYRCSGFFVDHNTVVTAAHCVYNTYSNQWHQIAYIYPGKNGGLEPGGLSVSGAFKIVNNYANLTPPNKDQLDSVSDSQYDFATITVTNNKVSNWFHFFSTAGTGTAVNASGYPADKQISYPYSMWRSLGNITATYSTYFRNNTYSTGGMSGGPVFNSINNMSAASLISYGSPGVDYGPRFTGATLSTLQSWKNGD
ncbi:trypsin-like peptidase domain-containing protein [Risungbinella massiliensis]|uniref:trypsin-like peptidase domain-containing protein n=1 Tax=Risungbinella massiliensis TaxID=1329796 RepID=UPI0005CC3C01|nr:trypsin-like peptidase domain-containing protein [Risungbinella massiliensis]